jgi:hypothetical protein
MGRREREVRRGELTMGSTDGSNRSPGFTVGQGERLLCVGKREWGRAQGGGWGA